MPIYIYGKRTQEDPCYFDKKLFSEDNNNNEEIEVNKVDEENKENIPDSKLLRVLTSNKDVQTSLAWEEEEYSWTSDSDKHRVAIISHMELWGWGP